MIIGEKDFNPNIEEYPDYLRREEIKKYGRDIIADKESPPSKKASAYIHFVIWSHYWRAREAIENCGTAKSMLKKIRGKNYYAGYVLDMDHYIPNWLYANGDSLSKEVLKCICEEFSYIPIENKYLPKGMTGYQGFNSCPKS